MFPTDGEIVTNDSRRQLVNLGSVTLGVLLAVLITWSLIAMHNAIAMIDEAFKYGTYAPSMYDSLGMPPMPPGADAPVAWGDALQTADPTGVARFLWESPAVGLSAVLVLTAAAALVLYYSLFGAHQASHARVFQQS